jgi:hypothetical protein
MTTGLSSTVANGLLNAIARATNYTAPTAVWIKLHIGDPGSAGTSNPAGETTRKQATFGSTASGGAISNTVALDWTAVSTSEDYSHYSAWDASTSGNFLFSGTLTAAAVTAADNFSIPIGDLDLAFTVAA